MIQDRFPKSLVNDMFEGNARFGHILHLPTLILSEGRDQEFMDLVDDGYFFDQEFLKQSANLESHLLEFHPLDRQDYAALASIISQYCPADFLVRVEAPIPSNFSFKDGKFLHCSFSWGYYRAIWVLAKDMADAATQAIAFASTVFEEEQKKCQ